MIILKFLIASLSVVSYYLITNKRHLVVGKCLRWVAILLFSFVWVSGGFNDYPYFKWIAGFVVIQFWVLITFIAVYQVICVKKDLT